MLENINEESGNWSEVISEISELLKKYNESEEDLEDILLSGTHSSSEESQIILLLDECRQKLGFLSKLYHHLHRKIQCSSLECHSLNVDNSDTGLEPKNKDEEDTVLDLSFPKVEVPNLFQFGVLEFKQTKNDWQGPVSICMEKTLNLKTSGDQNKYQAWSFLEVDQPSLQEVECLAEDCWEMLSSLLLVTGVTGAEIRVCFDPGGP